MSGGSRATSCEAAIVMQALEVMCAGWERGLALGCECGGSAGVVRCGDLGGRRVSGMLDFGNSSAVCLLVCCDMIEISDECFFLP